MKRAILSPSSEATVVTVPCDGLPLPGSCEHLLEGGFLGPSLPSPPPPLHKGHQPCLAPQKLGQAQGSGLMFADSVSIRLRSHTDQR